MRPWKSNKHVGVLTALKSLCGSINWFSSWPNGFHNKLRKLYANTRFYAGFQRFCRSKFRRVPVPRGGVWVDGHLYCRTLSLHCKFNSVLPSGLFYPCMRLWYFSSSVNLFLKCACAAIRWGLPQQLTSPGLGEKIRLGNPVSELTCPPIYPKEFSLLLIISTFKKTVMWQLKSPLKLV